MWNSPIPHTIFKFGGKVRDGLWDIQRWKLMLYWQAMSYRTTALGIPFIWLRASQRVKSMFICLSPFWKSMMLGGTKQPCLVQAMAPIPVVSRWRWEPWVPLMAWCSLQVDFYKIHWAETAKGSNTHKLGILGGRQMLVKLIQGSKVTSFLCQMDILTISPSSHVLGREVAIHDKNSLVLPVISVLCPVCRKVDTGLGTSWTEECKISRTSISPTIR